MFQSMTLLTPHPSHWRGGERWGQLYLLWVGEVREVLESEGADDGEDGEEAAGEEDDPGVLAQQDYIPASGGLSLKAGCSWKLNGDKCHFSKKFNLMQLEWKKKFCCKRKIMYGIIRFRDMIWNIWLETWREKQEERKQEGKHQWEITTRSREIKNY